MKKFGLIFFIFLFVSSLFLVLANTNQAHAQLGQIWETIVGNPQEAEPEPEPDPGGGSGGGGSLDPGEFKPPFRCGLSYKGLSYPDHPRGSGTSLAVDFNRGTGDTDEGDPVRASANGKVVYIDKSNGHIIIAHSGGYDTGYGHMRGISVGYELVRLGQKIGEISDVSSLYSISPHLHVYHRKNKTLIRVSYYNKPYPASLYKIPSHLFNCLGGSAYCSNVEVTGPCP